MKEFQKESCDNTTLMLDDDYYRQNDIVSISQRKINTLRYKSKNCRLNNKNVSFSHFFWLRFDRNAVMSSFRKGLRRLS